MRFRPSLLLTLVLAPLVAAFLWLGDWQMRRAEDKEALEHAFRNPPVVESGTSVAELPLWTRVALDGRYDPGRHILVDNQIEGGRAGIHVLTPFQTRGGALVLINRGWLPLPPDRSLPSFETTDDLIRIEGIRAPAPAVGRQLGADDRLHPDRWPQLVTYFDSDNVAEALGEALSPGVIWLHADDPSGFGKRAWSPVVMSADRHVAYAVQWYALAATVLVIWFVIGLRRGTHGEQTA